MEFKWIIIVLVIGLLAGYIAGSWEEKDCVEKTEYTQCRPTWDCDECTNTE